MILWLGLVKHQSFFSSIILSLLTNCTTANSSKSTKSGMPLSFSRLRRRKKYQIAFSAYPSFHFVPFRYSKFYMTFFYSSRSSYLQTRNNRKISFRKQEVQRKKPLAF